MNDCIFCKIVRGEAPATKTYEDDRTMAFLSIEPKSPGHTLLIPKEHHTWFQDMPDDIYNEVFKTAKKLAQTVKTENDADFVRLAIVGTDVPHVHLHLIPQKKRSGPIAL